MFRRRGDSKDIFLGRHKALKRITAILVATGCAGCTSVERVPWSPVFPCAQLGGFANAGLHESVQVAFLSDGLKIGALLTKPKGEGPFPVCVHNHAATRR